MKPQRSTQQMLAVILDAYREMNRVRVTLDNCPPRMRPWCEQEYEYRTMLFESLKAELSMRPDAHAIETALRFLATANEPDDASTN